MRRARRPCRSWAVSSSVPASVWPAMTTEAGPLTAAIHSRPGQWVSRRSWTWSRGAATETMQPVPASSTRACERATTTRTASCRVKIPATQAAAISPCECPTTAAGTTPTDSHTRARPTITANITGCTRSTPPNPTTPTPPAPSPTPTAAATAPAPAPPTPPPAPAPAPAPAPPPAGVPASRRTSRTDHPASSSTTAETSPTARANTSHDPNSSTPIPAHCHPCPGNTSTGADTEPPTTPDTTPNPNPDPSSDPESDPSPDPAKPPNPSTNSPTPPPTTTNR